MRTKTNEPWGNDPQMSYGLLDTQENRIRYTCFVAKMLPYIKHTLARGEQGYPNRFKMVRLNSSIDDHINGKLQQRYFYPQLKQIK